MLIDKELKSILKISIGVAVFIHVISIIVSFTGYDTFNKLIVDIKLFGRRCCSFWPFSHFIFYGILTYMFPSKWKEIFMIGLLWETYELIMSKLIPKNAITLDSVKSKIQYDETWWFAEPLDIFFNTMGISLALLIRHIQKNGKFF